MEVQKIFTKIRNELNNREDEILNEIDKKFDELYCDEKIFKDKNKLMNIIKFSLENGKKIKYNNEKLLSFINDCINIENNIKDINSFNENIKKFKNSKDIKIIFDYGVKEQFSRFIEKIKNFGYICAESYFDSLILNENNNDINKKSAIINWIKQKTKKNQMKFERIFLMSQNGSSSKDFHNYCDNKGPTLTIIKTNKNKLFGGFTSLSWDSKSENKIDENNETFLYSLDLMKKYDLINHSKEAIVCNKSYGPYFGGRDFSIEANMKEGNTYANSATNFITNNNLELTGGKGNNESFVAEEIEVFKVIF